jgi:DNA-directed RNA polymerase
MLRDEIGGKATNLIPAAKPSDIYGEVAKVAAEIIRKDAEEGSQEAVVWLGKMDRKLTKRNTMTLPYGVTTWGMRDQLVAEVEDLLAKGKLTLATDDVFKACRYLADVNNTAISQVVVAARKAMDWLQHTAKIVASDGLPITWTSPVGFPIQQRYLKYANKVMDMTFSKVRLQLAYSEETSNIDASRMSMGISPNFVHGCDAAHLMKTINLCSDNEDIQHFSMIHDSYGTHAGSIDELSFNLRKAFIMQYSSNVLDDFRKTIIGQLKAAGREDLAGEIRPLPDYGNLDLEAVMDSEYFFA